jgi:hypothetical protein
LINEKHFKFLGLAKDRLSKIVFESLYEVYLVALQDATPVDTGLVRSSWDLVEESPFNYAFINLQGNVCIFLEEGTKPHLILPKKAKALRFEVGRKERLSLKAPLGNATIVYAKSVKHPGTEALYFIKGVFDSEKNFGEFRKVLEKKFVSELAKK